MKFPCELFGKSSKLLILGGYWEGKLALFCLETCKLLSIYQQHLDTVTSLAVQSPEEEIILTGSRDGEVICWTMAPDKEPRLVYKESHWDHNGPVSHVAVSSNLRVFASCSSDGMVFVYGLFRGGMGPIHQFSIGNSSPVWHVSIVSAPLACLLLFHGKHQKELACISINGQLLVQKRMHFSQITSWLVEPDEHFNELVVSNFSSLSFFFLGLR